MIDNGVSWQETIETALKSVGYADEHARIIVEKDKYAQSFYDDIKYCKKRVCGCREHRVSFLEMFGQPCLTLLRFTTEHCVGVPYRRRF